MRKVYEFLMLRVMEDLGMNSAMVNLNNSMTKAGWFYHLVTERYSPWTKYLQYKDTKL